MKEEVVEISIALPASVYAALDERRRNNLVPQPHPDNPEAHIMAPQFPSVEDLIERIVAEQLAPVVEKLNNPDAAALKAEIDAKQSQLLSMTRATAGARRIK